MLRVIIRGSSSSFADDIAGKRSQNNRGSLRVKGKKKSGTLIVNTLSIVEGVTTQLSVSCRKLGA